MDSRVIVRGKVAKLNTRQVQGVKDPSQVYIFTTALILGDECLAEVDVPESVKLSEGQLANLVCTVSVNRGNAQLRVESVIK